MLPAYSSMARDLLNKIFEAAGQALKFTAEDIPEHLASNCNCSTSWSEVAQNLQKPQTEERSRAHRRFWLDIALVHRSWLPIARSHTFKKLSLFERFAPADMGSSDESVGLAKRAPPRTETFFHLLIANPALGSYVSECKMKSVVLRGALYPMLAALLFPHLTELDLKSETFPAIPVFGSRLKKVVAQYHLYRTFSTDLIGPCPRLEELKLGFCLKGSCTVTSNNDFQHVLPCLRRVTLQSFRSSINSEDEVARLWRRLLLIVKSLVLRMPPANRLDTFSFELETSPEQFLDGHDMNAALQVLFSNLAHRLEGGRLSITRRPDLLFFDDREPQEIWPMSSLEEASFEHLFIGLRALELGSFYALGIDLEALPLPHTLEELSLENLAVDLVSTGPCVWEKLVSGLSRQCPRIKKVAIHLRDYSGLLRLDMSWAAAVSRQRHRLEKLGVTANLYTHTSAHRERLVNVHTLYKSQYCKPDGHVYLTPVA